ncbi:universal stress protein, partial [Candidatus Sumerlaeota bacterium]|nr:universal stress protein [Candidatus Sumerlaeota bacterium]
MARSILLALDGSPASDAAIDYGIRLARRNPEVRLTGLGILDEGEIRGPEAVPLGGEAFKEQRDKALLDEAHAKVQSFLAAFQSRCAQAGMNPKIIEARGVPYEEIELEARHHDLVLIERETHFHFETRETESDVFPSLARGSVRPMVAVSTEAPAESGVILVAYDDSRPAARALQMFQLLGLWKDRTVRILTANADPEEAEAR